MLNLNWFKFGKWNKKSLYKSQTSLYFALNAFGEVFLTTQSEVYIWSFYYQSIAYSYSYSMLWWIVYL